MEKLQIDTRFEVIYNGIDLRAWKRRRYTFRKPYHVVSVGALEKYKGHEVLVRAISRARKQNPDVSLSIIGDGPEYEQLQSLAGHLGALDHVHMVGKVNRMQVKTFLTNASVFALPSRIEGFGMALLEAMAMGLVPVASNVGGVPEVIPRTIGYLVPPDNYNVLARTIITAIDESLVNPAIAHDVRSHAKQFSISRTLRSYQRLFMDLQHR
jgi:glycosyltransferase involved in cell wall biosynthesis